MGSTPKEDRTESLLSRLRVYSFDVRRDSGGGQRARQGQTPECLPSLQKTQEGLAGGSENELLAKQSQGFKCGSQHLQKG